MIGYKVNIKIYYTVIISCANVWLLPNVKIILFVVISRGVLYEPAAVEIIKVKPRSDEKYYALADNFIIIK